MKLSIAHLLMAVMSLGLFAFTMAAEESTLVSPKFRGLRDSKSSNDDEGDPDSACCAGDPETLTFKFTRDAGGTCAASSNDQNVKDPCTGSAGADGSGPRIIRLTDAEFVGGGNPTQRSFDTGDEFEIKPADGKEKFKSTTKISVGNQNLKIHTSCSQPLSLGDIYGSLTLDGYSPRPVECAVCVDDKPQGRKDTGCTDECPLCDAPAEGEIGEECKACKNDASGAGQDSGCPSETPLCDAPDNAYGNE